MGLQVGDWVSFTVSVTNLGPVEMRGPWVHNVIRVVASDGHGRDRSGEPRLAVCSARQPARTTGGRSGANVVECTPEAGVPAAVG